MIIIRVDGKWKYTFTSETSIPKTLSHTRTFLRQKKNPSRLQRAHWFMIRKCKVSLMRCRSLISEPNHCNPFASVCHAYSCCINNDHNKRTKCIGSEPQRHWHCLRSIIYILNRLNNLGDRNGFSFRSGLKVRYYINSWTPPLLLTKRVFQAYIWAPPRWPWHREPNMKWHITHIYLCRYCVGSCSHVFQSLGGGQLPEQHITQLNDLVMWLFIWGDNETW